MDLIKRFKSLPISSRRLLSIGMILALVAGLPLFVWAIVTQRFLIIKHAASGEPAVKYGQPLHIGTAYAKVDASDFWITVNGTKFVGRPVINVHSDPGSATYTTLEATWQENGVEMRLFLYFDADAQNWWLREARIYNGTSNGDWVYLLQNAQIWKSPLGTPFEEGLQYGLVKNDSNGRTVAEVQFQNLTVQAFLNRTVGGSVPCLRQPPHLTALFNSGANPAPGSSANISIIFKNMDSGLCQEPYSHMAMYWTLPTDSWSVNSPISDIYTSAGDTKSFVVDIYNPPNTPTGQTYYPTLTVSNTNIFEHHDVLPISYYVQYNGGPTPVATATPAVPNCGATCGTNYNCQLGLICSNGFCRNPSCVSQTNCFCPGQTPSPSPTGLPPSPYLDVKVLVKLAGVSDTSANGAHLMLRFQNPSIDLTTSPLTLQSVGGGFDNVYEGIFRLNANTLPPNSNYFVSAKGEKHLANKYCFPIGQSQRCSSSQGNIVIPSSGEIFLDFSGLPLEPGDLFPQDGKADMADFAKITALLTKPCNLLTLDDRLVGDLDYNACVNVRDAFLMRQTLQTRFDEN